MIDNKFNNKNINQKVFIDGIYDIINTYIIKEAYIMDELINLKNKHSHTAHHSVRVGVLSGVVGIYNELSEKEIVSLITAGLLHDIGKIDIPINILDKPSKLTNEEFDIIKKHPIYGYNRLLNNPSIDNIALDAVLHHHEKIDGTGYPHGLRREELSGYTQIIGISDIFDAITSNRPYHNKETVNNAFNILKKDTKKLHKELVINVIDCILVNANNELIKEF